MVNPKPFSSAGSTFLNALRAVAAQIVVIGHTIAIGKVWPAAGEPNSPYMQSLGVVMFFVLSGYVITHTTRLKVLAPKSDYGLGKFTIDRFSRIFTVYVPALVLVFLLTVLYRALGSKPLLVELGIDQFLGNLFMLQSHPIFTNNWLSRMFGGPLGHVEAYGLGRPFWSIALEWWFYLAFGFIYFFFKVWRSSNAFKRTLLILGLAIAMIIPMVQLRGHHFTLLLSWFLGSMISFVTPLVTQVFSRLSARLVSSTGLVILAFSPIPLYLFHKSAYSISFVLLFSLGLLVTLVGMQTNSSNRFTKGASFFADYSYSLYAIHYPIVMLFLFLPFQPWLWTFTVVLVSNIAAYYFYEVFEKRHKTFRSFLIRRFF